MRATRRHFLSTALAAAGRGAAAGLHKDRRLSELAHPKTQFALRSYLTREEWQARRRHLRFQILSAAGLHPLPAFRPVPVEKVRQTRHDGFVTEVLLLETLPGYFVGATVYRPVDGTVRHPAVLIAHGHWKHGRVEHLPSYSVPALGINLALQGYVALSWDMVGYNDTRQTDHSFGGWREVLWGFNPLGLQLWNSIRVLDYVETRSDVDPRRIACTGASGGGTQTILLTAVDGRIACSAPVNMISAHYQGADPCEEAPNLRLGTNNVEIAALAAPRPMLVVSCTGDWTRNTPEVEFPAIRHIYSLYGQAHRVSNAHFEAEHNYDRNSREAVYAFFAQWLLGKQTEPKDVETGPVDRDDLLAFSNGRQRPAEALNYPALLEQWIAMSRRQNAAMRDTRRLAHQLLYAIGCEWPRRVDSQQWGEFLILSRPGQGDRVPALWTPGRGAPAVLIHPDGKEALADNPEVARLRAAGRPLLVPDVFLAGQPKAERERGGKWFLSYNQTDDANRIQDILTALSFAHLNTRQTPELIGFGKAQLWCTFAAATAPIRVDLGSSDRVYEGTDEELRENCFVPCLQRAGGLDAALRILARRR